MTNNKIGLVLPMYNEEGNVESLIEALSMVRQNHSLDLLAICVNDGSADNTLKLLQEASTKYNFVRLVNHGKNKGLGQAIRSGIGKALELKVDLIGFMDGDLTHDPNDLPKFVAKVNEGYDFVIGSRFIKGGGMVQVPLFRQLFSIFGNLAARFILRVPVRDCTTGYRVIKREVFEKIKLEEPGFGIQLEEVVKAYAAGFKIGEVPIILGNRVHGKSKMFYGYDLVKNYLILFRKSLKWLKEIDKK